MKSINSFIEQSSNFLSNDKYIEGMTDTAYIKNPKAFGDIEKQTKIYAEDIIKNMEDYCENDEQKSDYLNSLIRNMWFEMPKGSRRKILLPVLKEFTDQ